MIFRRSVNSAFPPFLKRMSRLRKKVFKITIVKFYDTTPKFSVPLLVDEISLIEVYSMLFDIKSDISARISHIWVWRWWGWISCLSDTAQTQLAQKMSFWYTTVVEPLIFISRTILIWLWNCLCRLFSFLPFLWN